MVGTVKWFNAKKGFGFIENEEKKDIYVHFSGIIMDDPKAYKVLNEGDKVSYEVIDGLKGPQAVNVKVI